MDLLPAFLKSEMCLKAQSTLIRSVEVTEVSVFSPLISSILVNILSTIYLFYYYGDVA
jgi:hypothetical protein